jgi:hypothetical protein
MAPNAALEPYCSASIGIGDRLALELLLGFTGMRIYGKAAKLRMYTIGNPMIAYTMLRHDVAAGLNVPVRVMIYEHPRSGSVKFAFDQPSSLMSLGSDQLAEAARKLDDKLVALAQHVTA